MSSKHAIFVGTLWIGPSLTVFGQVWLDDWNFGFWGRSWLYWHKGPEVIAVNSISPFATHTIVTELVVYLGIDFSWGTEVVIATTPTVVLKSKILVAIASLSAGCWDIAILLWTISEVPIGIILIASLIGVVLWEWLFTSLGIWIAAAVTAF